MKIASRTLLMIALITFSQLAIAQNWNSKGKVTGNGNVVTQERNVGSFDGLDVGGAWDIKLVKGNEGKLVIELDENLLEHLETVVKNGTLHFNQKKNFDKLTKAKATIYYKDIKDFDLSGAVKVIGDDGFSGNSLSLDCSGASSVTLNGINVQKINADFSGASNLKFSGKANAMMLDISGAGNMNAYDLTVADAMIDASGASNIKIHVTDDLSVEASGASNIRYKGNPSVDKDVSGGASVRPSSK